MEVVDEDGSESPGEEYRRRLVPLRNWGRWGVDDQKGAVNLITAEKTLDGVRSVRLGMSVSLSRPFPTAPAPNNTFPASHYMNSLDFGGGEGAAVDYIGIAYHGQATTHLDALCHVWDENGMWNGRDPVAAVGFSGVSWGGVEQWSAGLVTRGVLLDVAGNREDGYVDVDEPVTPEELSRLAEGLDVKAGDALVIHSGRDAWEAATGRSWSAAVPTPNERPGLASSCLEFFRATDCSVVIWDMADARPNEYGVSWGTHAALFTLGLGLLDNALLTPLAEICREHNRTDFLVVVAPLIIEGGTGSPVNPLAVL
jgi:hypothetical protein